jgi:hypothetical protein
VKPDMYPINEKGLGQSDDFEDRIPGIRNIGKGVPIMMGEKILNTKRSGLTKRRQDIR